MNYYEMLDIQKHATTNEIKFAYHMKVKIHHPDKGGNQDLFTELTRIYNILIDPIKRKEYDETGDVKERESVNTAVRRILSNFFLEYINNLSSFHVKMDDLFLALQKEVKINQKKFKRDIRNNEKNLKRLEEILNRIEPKNSFFSKILENEIGEIEISIEQRKVNIEVAEKALKFLKDYKYRTDDSKMMNEEVYLGDTAREIYDRTGIGLF